jgi:hypothetical protein
MYLRAPGFRGAGGAGDGYWAQETEATAGSSSLSLKQQQQEALAQQVGLLTSQLGPETTVYIVRSSKRWQRGFLGWMYFTNLKPESKNLTWWTLPLLSQYKKKKGCVSIRKTLAVCR